MDQPEPFSGEVALVTGASRGIGKGIALALARRGADLALVQRGDAAETAEEIRGLGRRVHVVRTDLERAEAAAEAVEEAVEELGRLDILVANAGIGHREPSLEVSLEDWRRVLDVNLTSAFAASQAAARVFVRQGGGGRIVYTASVMSFQGGLNISSYAASKSGIAGLTRALANEWAPLGIRVNAVAPGYIENDFNVALRADPVRKPQIDVRIPAARWGTNAEIGEAVAFLVSPEASYVHGHVLAVDGGWLAR